VEFCERSVRHIGRLSDLLHFRGPAGLARLLDPTNKEV